jgi:hypothetical protein
MTDNVHRLVDFLWGEAVCDVLHGLAGLLHSGESLTVDVGRLDGVDLLLEGTNLLHRLLHGVLVVLLASQGGQRRYSQDFLSAMFTSLVTQVVFISFPLEGRY